MQCQNCQKRPATVHLTQIINGDQNVKHLCERCAYEQGEFHFSSQPSFSIHNLLTGLMNMDSHASEKVVGYPAKVQCETCGLTYAQFGQIGRFGCSGCYAAFGERLLPMMRRIHGSGKHIGKIPARAGTALKVRRSIEEMRRELQRLISVEEFEQAAQLRDKIRQMETGMQTGGAEDAVT